MHDHRAIRLLMMDVERIVLRKEGEISGGRRGAFIVEPGRRLVNVVHVIVRPREDQYTVHIKHFSEIGRVPRALRMPGHVDSVPGRLPTFYELVPSAFRIMGGEVT